MKKLVWVGLALALAVFAAAGPLRAQDNTAPHTITLYSPLQYNHDQSRASVYFEAAAYAGRYSWGDVGYGVGRFGNEFDWLMISSGDIDRSVIKDLGPHDWSDKVTVPWVEPLAKLKPGEHRKMFVDTSGKASRVVDISELSSERPGKPKREGQVRTSPNLIKALLGHMYVLHVVDDQRDFYALFRIDSLQRGDNCTISWKLIPPPPTN
jgi:hypothetical protein